MIAESLQFGAFARTRSVTALIELARNALEYAGGGRVRLSVLTDRDGLSLRAVVSDRGGGIPDPDLLFGSQKIETGGLGLGLRGVRRIADRFKISTGSEGTQVDVAFHSKLSASDINAVALDAGQKIARLDGADPVAQLAEQNRDLLDALAARDLLMQEIHHRTSNNLALISSLIEMSRSASDTAETQQVLGELYARVHAVMKAHEQMQRAAVDDQLQLIPFLRGVAEKAQQAFNCAGLEVAVTVRGDDMDVSGKVAIDLGLVVGELITNAYKHAFAGRDRGAILVEIRRGADETTLLVVDDGRGLPAGTCRPERSQSLGWELIRSTAQQYDGLIETDGRNGFSVSIRFARDLAIEGTQLASRDVPRERA